MFDRKKEVDASVDASTDAQTDTQTDTQADTQIISTEETTGAMSGSEIPAGEPQDPANGIEEPRIPPNEVSPADEDRYSADTDSAPTLDITMAEIVPESAKINTQERQVINMAIESFGAFTVASLEVDESTQIATAKIGLPKVSGELTLKVPVPLAVAWMFDNAAGDVAEQATKLHPFD